MSRCTKQNRGGNRLYSAFIGLLLLTAFIVFVNRPDRFPYQGTWQAGSQADGFTAKFHFAPDGSCSTEYNAEDRRTKNTPCAYVMSNGTAVVEYVYNWKSGSVRMGDCDYTWYHARLTPIEGGHALLLQVEDVISRKSVPGQRPENAATECVDSRELRFERVP
jgi:hypothetical protein